MKQSEITIFRKKSGFMQSCLDAARSHTYFMSGLIKLEKVQDFHAKMSRKYEVNLPKMEAYRLRKGGAATCKLNYYKMPESYSLERNDLDLPVPNDQVIWVMFSSEGQHPFGDEGDTWRDLKGTDRLNFMGLEMVQVTRRKAVLTAEQVEAGKKLPKPKQTPSWTWRFTDDYYSKLRNKSIEAIKTHSDWMIDLILREAKATPGFSAVREQLKKLVALIRGEWLRHRKDSKMPELPSKFGYVRRVTAGKVKLSTALKANKEIMARHELQMASILAESGEAPTLKLT